MGTDWGIIYLVEHSYSHLVPRVKVGARNPWYRSLGKIGLGGYFTTRPVRICYNSFKF